MIETRGMQMRTVGQVAAEFGVTVRTLHHYDEFGLLTPRERSGAGYRLYTDEDVARLGQIVAYRRLGFPLEQVAAVLACESEALSHLQRQRAAVSQQISELTSLADALHRAVEAEMNGYQISTDEQREIFGEAFNDDYAQEAEDRWGQSQAWAQSRQRTKHYTKAQWQQIKDDTDEINEAYAALLAAGNAPTDEPAMDVAERARQQITTWFYTCSPQMHANIAQFYIEDPRFTATYEQHAVGLAQFVHDAIAANTTRHTGADD